jgi:hypothetical protein
MKKTVSIEIEETVTRIVVPGDIHCPACGAIVSLSSLGKNASRLDRNPWIETVLLNPENTKLSEHKEK